MAQKLMENCKRPDLNSSPIKNSQIKMDKIRGIY